MYDSIHVDVCVFAFACSQYGEQLKKMPGSTGVNPYAQLVEDADGLDKIEALQDHPNEELYEKAVHILETYFDIEEGEDQNLTPAVTAGGYAFGAPGAGQPAAGGAPMFDFGGAGGDASQMGGQQSGMFNFSQQH